MLLLKSLMPFGELRSRCLIYDGKREFVPYLIGMGVPAELIYILNPADARSVAWDIAKDINNRDDAVNIVHILIPEDKNHADHAFFVHAIRAIIVEVIMCLHSLNPGKWRLIDVLNALRTPDLIRRVLRTTREGSELCSRYFGSSAASETVGSIIASIDARFLSKYETIACWWARCGRSISLSSWVNDKSILLLGFDANSDAVNLINQATFLRLSQLVCSLPEDPFGKQEQTLCLLDEKRFMGKLAGLPELMSFGRSKNAKVLLSLQDLDGLYDAYGEHKANEMLALCGNVGILKLMSPKTREWAAKLFGNYEAWEDETTDGVSHGPGGTTTSHGTSHRKVNRESILPSEFFDLPPTDRVNGIHGFFYTPAMGAWRAEIPFSFIDQHLAPTDPEALPFVPRPEAATEPVRWTEEDEQKFTRLFDGRNPPKKPDANPGADPDEEKPNSDEEQGTDPLPDW